MQNVYDENGGYTEDANNLDKKTQNCVRKLIANELKAGTPIEAIMYVMQNAISKEILKQSIESRILKKAQELENNKPVFKIRDKIRMNENAPVHKFDTGVIVEEYYDSDNENDNESFYGVMFSDSRIHKFKMSEFANIATVIKYQ